jgi:hypothetical protein
MTELTFKKFKEINKRIDRGLCPDWVSVRKIMAKHGIESIPIGFIADIIEDHVKSFGLKVAKKSKL